MKKKLNINELKVESFITDLNSSKEQTVQGGKSGNGCYKYSQDDNPFCVKSWLECKTLQFPCRNTVDHCEA